MAVRSAPSGWYTPVWVCAARATSDDTPSAPLLTRSVESYDSPSVRSALRSPPPVSGAATVSARVVVTSGTPRSVRALRKSIG